MAAPDEKKPVPCSECVQLLDRNRPYRGPHEYLVMTGRDKAGTDVFMYKCLLCGTLLRNERIAERWTSAVPAH